MKVLFVTSEAAPFIRTGGLGDVAGALPYALRQKDVDIRIILPYYSDIPDSYKHTMNYIGNIYVPLSWRYQYCGVFSQVVNGVKYYFIDNEYYFKRQGIYGHYDDAERFAFFSRAVLEILPVIDFYPDVIHCNDWQTAMVPVMKDVFYTNDEKIRSARTLFTIHNIEYQGKYGREIIRDILGLPEGKEQLVDYAGCVNMMKGAIECSNVVSTVSRSYAHEILDPYYSYGLDGILKAREYKLCGVVNGLDTQLYNPATDMALFENYDYASFTKKAKNKDGLGALLGLNLPPDKPLIAMVTRLTAQKGIDLVARVMDEIMAKDVRMVILGTGDWKYETMLKEAEKRFPSNLRVIISFSKDLAQKIYAAADMFLMPSKFEPCGLSQMISMRYGTVPVVRETGGLKDTVAPYNGTTGKGVGFTFCRYDAYDMLDAIDRAIGVFGNKTEWKKVVRNGMTADWSWDSSAAKYIDIYEKIGE